MKRRLAVAGGGALLALAAYLLAWPSGLRPEAWSPPAAPGFTGPYEANDRLADAVWMARGAGVGPEATAFDAQGRLYTGVLDGRILRMNAEGGAVETWAETGGRPLGLAFDAAGNLVVADASRGLLSIAPDRTLSVLASGHAGRPFLLVDDVAIAADGTVYFTDASARFGLGQYRLDLLEHGATGRLLAYRPANGSTEVVLDGLVFANGVALSPDGAFALVCETGAYRLRRAWLSGEKRGRSDVFIDNLPGFPDNVTTSPRGDVFWLALASPRQALLDGLMPRPWARKVVARLPEALQPGPERHGTVLGLGLDGRVRFNLQDGSPSSYSPVTSAREREGVLYLGSFLRDALARLPAPGR